MHLTLFLPQKCQHRYRHPNSRAGCQHLEGRQDRDTYADLTKRECTLRYLHPALEGPAKVVAQMRPDGSPHAMAYGPAVRSVPRGPGSRTSRVHRLAEAACLIGSSLHRMRILAGLESQKFGGGGSRIPNPRSRYGARPRHAANCPDQKSPIDRDGLPSAFLYPSISTYPDSAALIQNYLVQSQ